MKYGFCDLNVRESSQFIENLANVKQLISLGYNCVAINRIHPIPENKTKDSSAVGYVNTMRNLLQKLNDALNIIKESANEDLVIPSNFKLLSRLTIPLNSVDQLGFLRRSYFNQIFNGFDLIAIVPENEKVFKSLMEGKFDIDIVSLAMEGKLRFKPTKESMGLGMSKEYAFEVCYSTAIKSVSLRKYIFQNGKQLVGKTKKGRGIIFSSGGNCWMDFRSPLDIVNLANLFDLKDSACYDVVKLNCERVVAHSVLRKTTFKGMASVEICNEDDGPSAKRKKSNV